MSMSWNTDLLIVLDQTWKEEIEVDNIRKIARKDLTKADLDLPDNS